MQKSSESSSLIMIGTTIPVQSETEKSDPKTNLPESGDSSSDEKSTTQKSQLVPSKKRVEEDEKHTSTATAKKSVGITTTTVEDAGRERLKRHRVEVAGRVWIPDMWGQENLLKDWIDCTAFDASLVNSSITSARDSLVEEARRANSARLRIQQN